MSTTLSDLIELVNTSDGAFTAAVETIATLRYTGPAANFPVPPTRLLEDTDAE